MYKYEYMVKFNEYPYPHTYYNLQDAIKDAASARLENANMYRNGDLIAMWIHEEEKFILFDERKSLQKAFDRFDLNSALTLDAVNEEIKSIAEKCNVEIEKVRKGKELSRVKPDADRLVTVEIRKNAIKDIEDWTVYDLIINPHIWRTLSKSTPQELYKVAEQVKQMAEFAEMLIAKKMKLKVKKG